MIITPELAQQILNHILPTIKHNVNIMNEDGIIIASSQPQRLHSFHAGAKEAIDNRRVAEVYPEDLSRFPGALPGLNWPMLMGGQVVGVVGVSGHPDEVRETAQLVKMVTELILEREALQEEFRAQTHLKEQFVTLLLSDQAPQKPTEIRQTASLLKFDLTLPRFVAVVDLAPLFESTPHEYGTRGLITLRAQETITQLLETTELVNPSDLAVFLSNHLVLLKFAPDTAAAAADLQRWGAQLHRTLHEATHHSTAVGIGSLSRNYGSLYQSYSEALHALRFSANSLTATSMYDHNVLSSYLIQRTAAGAPCDALSALADKITALDTTYAMRQTIATLLEHNLNISAAAKSLFIHRNTLLFRLERLRVLTGLEPASNLNHAFLCKLLFSSLP